MVEWPGKLVGVNTNEGVGETARKLVDVNTDEQRQQRRRKMLNGRENSSV
jgi:hypothetical protein